MKFSPVSAAAIVAALSLVQAAPLSARSSALALDLESRSDVQPHDRRDNSKAKEGGPRTIGQEFADNERLAKEKGLPLDRRDSFENSGSPQTTGGQSAHDGGQAGNGKRSPDSQEKRNPEPAGEFESNPDDNDDQDGLTSDKDGVTKRSPEPAGEFESNPDDNDDQEGLTSDKDGVSSAHGGKREVLDRREPFTDSDDPAKASDSPDNGASSDQDVEDSSNVDHAKREALGRRQGEQFGDQSNQPDDSDDQGEDSSNADHAKREAALDDREVSKETKATLDELRAGALSSPAQED
ncbi:hypothetical protein LX36DRAFT_751645 [Colletotrichum falcatum]|nr:hypothetical protein LX36DRAFT_751645 [Colletotrichum falcatum]